MSHIMVATSDPENLMIVHVQMKGDCGEFDRERREFVGKLNLERDDEQIWENDPFWTNFMVRQWWKMVAGRVKQACVVEDCIIDN